MSSTSNAFADGNSGTQVGINHGQIYFSSAPQKTPQQSIDNEVLRSLAFPEMLDRRDNIEPCHPDTCQWILELEKYKSWRSQSRGLLWIKGKPGAGKSTLMLFLHDKLKRDVDHGIRLEFFFTARGTEMQRIPLGMLRSLLSQLFDRDATIRPQVRDAYEQRCRHFGYGEREWEWPRVVLEELLAGTILASASRRHIMIFVDALDEAGAESAQHLAAYFHRLIDRAEKQDVAVQICISCRHYPIMQSDPAREICVEDHNHDDIARYIKDILTDTDVGDGPGQDTREALAEQLIRQCNGVFQWAHLVMPLIRQKILEGESFDDIRCWLHEVPVGLEYVYTYILNNVIEGRNRAQSFLLFQWVSLAERPLTVTEMRYALAAQNAELTFPPKTWEKIDGFVESNGRMKRRIQVLSGGLAEVISTMDYHENVTGTVHEIVHETVQVVHQSVNDFLLAKGLGLLCHNIGTSTLPMDGERIIFQCQATLYRTCLVYLATVHMAQKISDKQDVIQDHPLLDYATYNLFIHAEKAADYRADVLQNEQDILQRVIGPWVQIYRIKYRYSKRCPQEDTTILHVAAAANLVDVMESVVSDGTDVMVKDIIGNTAFHLAASQGHITAGKILREKGADREAKNENGITPLTEAARCGHVRFVEWLLHEGVKVETSARSEGALQAASLEGHQRVVAILLGAGADVNAQGGHYGNALQAAAYGGNTEIVQMLLDAHADVNTQGGEYGNALQGAAYGGNTEIVQMLLEAHADVNAQGGVYGNALQAAAYGGDAEIVQMLLDAHADVNAQGGLYGNALQGAAAAYGGNTEIVQMLLDAHADVNAQGGLYSNALQAAAHGGNTEIVQMLLDAHADVNAQGGLYSNALQAAAYGGNTEIVQMLLDAHADVNAQGDVYGNALQAAAYGGNTEIVQVLLDAHADVNAQGGYYGNVLQGAVAAYRGNTEIVQILLDAHADINAQGGLYGNALQGAAHRGNTEIVQMLLDAHADVNAQGGEYGNALQGAAYGGNPEIVQMLLDAYADVNAQGGLYGNALQAAAYGEDAEIVQMLLDAHADVNAQGGYYGNALQGAAAAFGGNTEIVQMLLEAHADVNAQGGEYGNALQGAAYRGNTEIVQMLLDAHADVNAQGGEYGNALQGAAYGGNTEIVQMLLEAHADVNAQGGLYGNALQAAAYRGNPEIVQMLLDAHADVNAQGGLYGNALQAAAYGEDAEIVQMLLDAHADINAQGGYYGNALQGAAHRGNTEIVQMLLEAHADVNAQGGVYGNALQAAAYGGDAEIVQILLDAHADVNAQGGEYGNALQGAVYGGNTEIVQMLLDAHADINAQGGLYRNALQAAVYGEDAEIVQMLLDAYADVNAQGGLYGNALQGAAAAYGGNTEIVQMLLDAHADINAQGGYYGNALQGAAHRGNTEIVQMLLDAHADVNAQGGLYGNALQGAAAAYGGNPEIVEMLLEAHADVNAQGGYYGNALQGAAYGGNTEIVQMLLDAHADVNAQGGYYGNALQGAAYRGNTEIVQMLLEAHADVNAQGGICGSPLLAAVQKGQILLHAGADVLLANEHDQTPLHIAAFENQLDLLNRFPLLASGINSRDKFLQTPLHLAICLGHIEFAEKLLQLGANPSLPDGYGRNILDWVVGNESLMHHIQNNCPPIVVTPKETQELTVRQSILQISDTLLRSKLNSPWPLLRQIGCYFLFLDDIDNAHYTFQLYASQRSSVSTSVYDNLPCGLCERVITGSYFVCRDCAYLDVCSSCVQKYPYHSRLHPNQEHKTFEVLYVPDNDSRLASSKSEQLSHFLSKIVHELSAPNTDITEAEPPNDSVSSPAPKKTVLVSRAILGRATLSYALLFGLLAVLLRYWFF